MPLQKAIVMMKPDVVHRQRVVKSVSSRYHARKIRHATRRSPRKTTSIPTDIAQIQQRLQYVLEAQEMAQIGFWEVTMPDRTLSWSPQILHLLGIDPTVTPPDLATIIHLIHPEDVRIFREYVRTSIDAGRPYEGDIRMLLESGEVRWVHVRGDAIRDSYGNIVRVLGTVQDITERKRLERERDENATLLNIALRNARSGVWRWDMDKGEKYRSPYVYDMLGYVSGDPRNPALDQLIHPDDVSSMSRATRAFLDSPINEYEHEFRMRAKDGSWRWLLSRARAERRPDGTARYVTGIFTDITERKQLEEDQQRTLKALAESEERLRTLGDNLSEGFIFRLVVSPDGNRAFSYLSAGVEVVTGRNREEIYKDCTQLYQCIHPDDVPMAIRAEFDAARAGTRVELTLRFLAPSGNVRWLHLRKFPLFQSNGDIVWDGVALDVTRQKEIQNERERLMQQVMELANHDPLTNLLNHRTFYQRLQTENTQAVEEGIPLAIAVIDLNSFKYFNDSYGHLVGDEILKQVAAFLRSCCDETDAIGRIGGDEFAILLPGKSRAEAEDWLHELQRRGEVLTYQPSNTEVSIPIGLSIGLATFPEDGNNATDVLYKADRRSLLNKGGDMDADIARLREALGDTMQGFSMLEALVVAVDNKDRYTRRHSEDVVTFTLAMAAELGLPEADKHSLLLASLLHDVGKIGVPNRVLRHPGKLSPADYEKVKQHPALSGVLISAVPELAHILDAVRYHHENWDGTGYPEGLQGEEIPFMARILAVADAFSAMITNRPYRMGMSKEEAARILRSGAGKQWDTRCVDALLRSQQLAPVGQTLCLAA